MDVVFDSDKVHIFGADDGVACSWVPVSWLADGAGIDDALFVVIELVASVEVSRWIEVWFIGEDACDMGVAAETALIDSLEDLSHFGG